jgi:flagella basal body P-ring formation protein FlgA
MRAAPVLVALFALAPGASAAEDLAARVERMAIAAVEATIEAPDRFEASASRADAFEHVPGEVRLETVEVGRPNGFGVASVRFRIVVGTTPKGEARATVRGVVRGPALVATRPLDRGIAVPVAAVAVQDADLTRLDRKPLRDASELGGLAPVRTLGAGRVLTPDLLVPVVVVRRGEPVDLKVEGRSMTVVARGIARADGAPGDRLAAENAVTGAVVVGEVQADGSLLVLGPSARR